MQVVVHRVRVAGCPALRAPLIVAVLWASVMAVWAIASLLMSSASRLTLSMSSPELW